MYECAIENSTTFEAFLSRNKEVKSLSFSTQSLGPNGRLWVEDIFGNTVLIITDIHVNKIREVRCYAPYDPSFVLFLLVKREGSQIMPEENTFFYFNHPYIINNEVSERATAKFLLQIKKNKDYKLWCKKISD